MIEVEGFKYNLEENYRDAFNKDEFIYLFTDYFCDYDYIVGDYAYSKLRLKGFYNKDNKKAKKFNTIDNKDEYIKEKCAYNCKYFVLKKI